MRVEGDDRRLETGLAHRLDDGEVAEMNTVERADRSGARQAIELAGIADDPHRRASASSGAMMRSGSASSTWNGPISVRRSDTQ